MRKQPQTSLMTVLVLAAFLGACSTSNQPQPQQTAGSQPSSSNQPSQSGNAGGQTGGQAAGSGAPAQAASQAQPAPPQPTVQTYTVPAGTVLSVRLSSAIDTGTAASGARFSGTLSHALTVSGVEVAPAGSAVTGQVADAVSSGRLNRPARLSLVLTSITPTGGSPVNITTNAFSMSGESHKKRDAELIGGGGGVGALVGAIAGKGKGAAIGAAIGAGAGAAGAAATGKKEIHLAAESALSFRLSRPASFTVTVSQ